MNSDNNTSVAEALAQYAYSRRKLALYAGASPKTQHEVKRYQQEAAAIEELIADALSERSEYTTNAN